MTESNNTNKEGLLNKEDPSTFIGMSRSKFNHERDYEEYDRKYDAIPDDDSQVEAMFQELKNNHKSGKLRDLDFRIE